MTFMEELRQQRWDDHRFYHHNRINQVLHLLSACCFLVSYVMLFIDPVIAVFVGWMLAFVLRQIGHFFFEPTTYDEVNAASHDHKESIKVGYNLKRKIVLISVWVGSAVLLYLQPAMFGWFTPATDIQSFLHHLALIWLATGIGALLFRTFHLFFLMGVQPGLVWFTKILTDPFHDVLIYHKSPYYIAKGDMYDNMTEWYDESLLHQTQHVSS
ncbi:MAG: hypothetical protein AUK35_01020 [Zetaproteobacteria bacterium CG2_30_46_52]|nr:MAG: hypothetical protein AUK35_01020 [Zetaproteobacteria bacterium CG2_30_46_52]